YVALFGVLLVLNLVGLVMVLSASVVTDLYREGSAWHYFTRQLIGVAGGAVLFLALVRYDYRRLRRLVQPLHAAVLALLVAVLVPGVGVNANGASRWIDLKVTTLQPGELAKLTTLL